MNVCILDAARTCIGCHRTLDEIARWGRMSAAEQWEVIARIEREREERERMAATATGGPSVFAAN